MSTPILQVHLKAEYGERAVLTDVKFELRPGESLGMVGTSGAGKSTLVMSLLGLLPWRGGKAYGEVLVNGNNLLTMRTREARQIRGKTIALIPQSPMTALNAAVSLRAHFREAWRAHQSSGQKGLESRLRELTQEVQLPIDDDKFLHRRPGQVSVGQAQRVLIALALLHRPSILIADEPTSALDPVTQAEIVRLLLGLSRRNGTALLYISHDMVSVLRLCDRVAVLAAGTIAETFRVAQIEQARHPVTLSLLRSLPVPASVLLSHFRVDRSYDGQTAFREGTPSESWLASFRKETEETAPPNRPIAMHCLSKTEKISACSIKECQSTTLVLCKAAILLRKTLCVNLRRMKNY
jgi:ABC-type glutathione transport system ATPase component